MINAALRGPANHGRRLELASVMAGWDANGAKGLAHGRLGGLDPPLRELAQDDAREAGLAAVLQQDIRHASGSALYKPLNHHRHELREEAHAVDGGVR